VLIILSDGELASGHVRRAGGKGKGLDRRAARKEKREAVKKGKSDYFSKSKEKQTTAEKRPGGSVDTRPAKRPKIEQVNVPSRPTSTPAPKPEIISAPEGSKSKSAPKLAQPDPRPATTKPTATKPTKPKSTPLSRLLTTSTSSSKKRTKDIEDEEIAWLEAKLGISKNKRKKKGYGGAFSADGLDGESCRRFFLCEEEKLIGSWVRYFGGFGSD
jgi:nucleolar MIF4G domain-containing protein 1